jgi:predicted nucleic acid-binding protein
VILVDTSIWIDHLRSRHLDLVSWLEGEAVFTHPFVVGELACGELRRRHEILALLGSLPSAPLATHDEVLALVESHRLFGRGIGWVDAHLLTSARLSGVRLATLDKPLARAARIVGIAS